MRHWSSLALITGLVVSLIALKVGAEYQPQVNNLLANPGFEVSGGSNWSVNDATFTITNQEKHLGEKCGLLTNRKITSVLHAPYGLKEGFLRNSDGKYTFGGWFKLASGVDQVVMQLEINRGGSLPLYGIKKYEIQGEVGTSWTYIKGTVQTDFHRYANDVKLHIYTKNGTADLYLDDLFIVKGASDQVIQRLAAPALTEVTGPDLSELKYLKKSDDYRVWIGGQEKFTYESLNNKRDHADHESVSFVNFDTNNETTVKVYPNETIYSYEVRPRTAKFTSSITADGMITFKMKPMQKAVVVINDSYNHPLVICANPEEKVPAPNEVTYYYGPGVHYVGAWFDEYWKGEVNPKTKLKSGESVYLAEGAVVIGAFDASLSSNVKIYGRGILYGGNFDETTGYTKFAQSRSLEGCTMIRADASNAIFTGSNSYLKWVPSGTPTSASVDNIVINGITICNSPSWNMRAFGEGKYQVTNFEINNVKTIGMWKFTTDGCQIGPNGFIVENCFLQTNDDNFSLNGNCLNGEIKNNIQWCNRNGGIYTLGWGPQRIENLYVHDNVIFRYDGDEGFSAVHAVFPLMQPNSNSVVKNLFFQKIEIEDLGVGAYWIDFEAKYGGNIEGITFDQINVEEDKSGIFIGKTETPMKKIVISNSKVGGKAVGDASTGNLNITNAEVGYQKVNQLQEASKIEMGNSVIGMEKGTSKRLLISVVDQDNQAILFPAIQWSSSHPEIATVSDGRVEAFKEGAVMITAVSGKVQKSVVINVCQLVPTRIDLSGPTEVDEEREIYLSASMRDQFSQPITKEIEWSSSDESIATISTNGKLTGIKKGNVTIKGRYKHLVNNHNVTVKEVPQVETYGSPGNLSTVENLGQSDDFAAKVAGSILEPFIYEVTNDDGKTIQKDWSFFKYSTKIDTRVNVKFLKGEITDYSVRPMEYVEEIKKVGNEISFKLKKLRHVVVEVNHDYHLVVSANPPAPAKPDPKDPNVLYYKAGTVTNVGNNFNPEQKVIYIEGGAIVEGLFRFQNRSGVKIIGRGVISCGEWSWQGEGNSKGLSFTNCDGMVIDGITLTRSPGWQLSIGDSDATIENVDLIATGGDPNGWYNTDGVQTWQGNSGTRIRNCFLLCRDDALNINSGTNNYLAENLVMWNYDNGGSIMFGWGGDADIKDITIQDCYVLENTSGSDGAGDYGGVDGWDKGVFSLRRGHNLQTKISNVLIKNIKIYHANIMFGMRIDKNPWNKGYLGKAEITFENIDLPHTKGELMAYNPDNSINLTFKNCQINGVAFNNTEQIQGLDYKDTNFSFLE